MTTKMSTSVLRALALLFVAWSLSACALYEDLEPLDSSQLSVEEVSVTPASLRLEIGETSQLSAAALGPNGDELEDREVEWSSSNPNRASVTTNGVVEGVAAGTVTITAQVDGVEGTAQVEVYVPIASVSVEPTEVSLEVGQTEQLSATVLDTQGNEVDASIVDWSSTSEDVASVDSSGLVEALMEGTTTITASADGRSATATVEVTATVADVEVSPNPAQVALGETTQLSATLTDANGNELSGRDVTWESSNESVATVTAAGIVTGVSEGDVDITATSEGESGTALVQVTRPVVTVEVTPDPITLDVGETEQLTAVARDANGDDLQIDQSAFSWRPGDPSIAQVTGGGLVEGAGDGTTEITAEVDGVSDSAQVTVNRPVVSIEISPSTATVDVSSTIQLTATLLDANDDVISGRTVNWTSSDPNIASVDDTGVVTGLQEGNVTITARAEGVNATADVTVGAPVDTVTITPDGGAIDVGDMLQLTASVEDSAGNSLSRPVTWSSSDTNVATVDSTGKVTGQMKGSADITAESETVTDTVTVNVSAPVATVIVTPDPVDLELNDTQQLDVELQDVNGNVLTGRTISWASGDSSIAAVDSSGVVTANAEGSTQITATSEGVSGSTTVNVTAPVVSVTVTPASTRIWSDGQVQLDVQLEDANGDPLSGRSVTWTSSDTSVATVDTSGLVSAAGPGEATITAESEGVSGTATVTAVEWGYIDAGQRFTCGALTDGEAYCWGDNDDGEIGNGTTGGTYTNPQKVQTTEEFVEISAGLFHNCAVTSTQKIFCWGEGGNAALGDGAATSSNTPVQVSGAYSWLDVSAGANHTCGRDANDDLYCWGINQDGQLGTGGTQDRTIPQSVAGAFKWSDVSAGLAHTCGLTNAGEVYCWGQNSYGQLGTGSMTALTQPGTKVGGTQTFVDVSSGAEHACAVTNNGEVYCWGRNSSGQIGRDPTTVTESSSPVQVTISGATVTSIELGLSYSCATVSNGDTYCWGFNGQGNFGNGGASATQHTPVKVGGGYDWALIGAGWQHTCGINQFVDAYCWGDNDNGEVGLGTMNNVELTPKAVTRPTL